MTIEEIKSLDAKYYMNTFGDRGDVYFTRGLGTKLYGSDGREYTDFFGGIAVIDTIALQEIDQVPDNVHDPATLGVQHIMLHNATGAVPFAAVIDSTGHYLYVSDQNRGSAGASNQTCAHRVTVTPSPHPKLIFTLGGC